MMINLDTTHPGERRLRNVIEERAIASGHSPSDAAIGVTHGCLPLLRHRRVARPRAISKRLSRRRLAREG